MATYVLSDIHGEYDLFMEMLDKIGLKDEDTLFVLGDVVDRGPDPIKTLLKLMEMPNAICIVGNHEYMAMQCIRFLEQEITKESIEQLDGRTLANLQNWLANGATSTIKEFQSLDQEMRQAVIDFIQDFSVFEEVTVNGTEYLLVHAGLGNYAPGKPIEEYTLHDIIWTRADYETKYFEDVYVISGHTPTQFIRNNPRPGYIYRANNHIAIDCGCTFEGGRLGAICLDTGEEFYVEGRS